MGNGDLSEQWSASIEVCACSCSDVWFPVCEYEFCPAFDKIPLKMFEFCRAFDKKFALDAVLPDKNSENPHFFKKKIRTRSIWISNERYFQAERQIEVYFHHWWFFISFLLVKQS